MPWCVTGSQHVSCAGATSKRCVEYVRPTMRSDPTRLPRKQTARLPIMCMTLAWPCRHSRNPSKKSIDCSFTLKGDVEHDGRWLQALRDALQAIQPSRLCVGNQSAFMMLAPHHIPLTSLEMQVSYDECCDRPWIIQLRQLQACKSL